MNIISWNLRGFSKSLRRRDVLCKCNRKKTDLFCILEGKIRRNKLKRCLKIFDEEWEWSANIVNDRAKMILFWRRKTVDLNIINMEKQVINCSAKMKNEVGWCKISFVYGANLASEKEVLWQRLREEETREPWLLIGDFNATLNEEERRRDRSVATYDQGFEECVRELEINDIQSTGCYYTWLNRRTGEDAIAAKLDRAMANGEWITRFPSTRVHFGEPLLSDHSEVEVRMKEAKNQRPKPFRFFNCWTDDEEYREILEKVLKLLD